MSTPSSTPNTPVTPGIEAKDKGEKKEANAEVPEVGAKTAKAAKADDTLPLLQRPLGVREKPKAKVKTWADTKEKFLDRDKQLEERTHLYVLCLKHDDMT